MNKRQFVELISSTKFLLTIALILAAFTHLWNVSQFPGIHIDEGHYIRKALHILQGLGLQESRSAYNHPYFGPIFLATIFKIIDYPDSLNPSTSVDSIEALYAVPRIFMGIFAILDTFLVYMIGRYCYGKNVAFVASVLFAVMPMSWQLRRVVLDSIQLPFVLSSILLAFLIKEKLANYGHKKITLIILLSGILLGLAIFTKIPAIFIIPFVLYLIIKYSRDKIKYFNEDQKQKQKNYALKNVGIWFIPVILIPLIWPAYAVLAGDFDKWVDGTLNQASGRGSRLLLMWESFVNIDPLLLSLTAGGLILSLIRKDFLPFLWVGPYVLFVLGNKWFLSFHWNLLLPAFCIYGALILVELPNRIKSTKLRNYVHVTAIGTVTLFGLVSIILLISLNISTGIFQSAAATLQYLKTELRENKTIDDFSIITSPVYTWLFKYPFEINNTLNFRDKATIKTPHVVLVIDDSFQDFIESYEAILFSNATRILDDNNLKTRFVGSTLGSWIKIDLGSGKKICSIKVSWYKGDSRVYNFTLSGSNDNRIFTEIASYQSNGKSISEVYETINTIGRYIDIHFNGNTDNIIGSISEIALYGSSNSLNLGECSKLLPKNIVLSNNSYIETGGNKRIEQIGQILSQTKVISKISFPEEYDSNVYPFTSMKYGGTPSIEIRAK